MHLHIISSHHDFINMFIKKAAVKFSSHRQKKARHTKKPPFISFLNKKNHNFLFKRLEKFFRIVYYV